MLYFVGGANNDQDGWDYIGRFQRIFAAQGIQNFNRVNATRGKNRDLLFTVTHNTEAWYPVTVFGMGTPAGTYTPPVPPPERVVAWRRINDPLVEQVARTIHRNLQAGSSGQQLNLAGYSYGSVFMAHVALLLVDNRYRIDYLILIGSPIPTPSRLYRYLVNHQSIGRVFRHDIPGDYLSNPTLPGQQLLGAFQNLKDSGAHFDLARPDDPSTPNVDEGAQSDSRIRALAAALRAAGVR